MKHLKKIFLAVGIALLGYLVWEIGWDNILRSLWQMGWWWPVLLGISVLSMWSHNMAWVEVLKGLGHRPSAWRLFRLKFIAEAVNTVAPSANLGGDVARAYLIRGNVPLTTGISSVMVDKTLDAFVKMFFNLIGLILAAIFIPLPPVWLWGAAAVLLAVFVGNSLMVVLQLKGFSGSVKKLARYLPPLRRKLENQGEKLNELAGELRHLYLKSPAQLLAASAWNVAGRLLGLFEIWLILQLLAHPVGFVGSYYIASIVNLIQSAFFFIPGQTGVAEGGQALLLKILGYSIEVGLSLGIIRRIRRLALTGVGLFFYYCQKKELPGPATLPPTEQPGPA